MPSHLPPVKVLNVREVKIDNGMALVVFISANMLKKLGTATVIIFKGYFISFIDFHKNHFGKDIPKTSFHHWKRKYVNFT